MKKNIFFILSVFLFFSCEKKLSNSDVEYVQQNIKPFTDINDFTAFNEVYARYFTEKPARSCVGVQSLPKGAICEVEVIAAV